MPENTLEKWDKRFLELAELVAQWSKDQSTKVGAVITDNKRRIISLGYNGLPRNVIDHPFRLANGNRELKYEMTVHAEANAILSARTNLEFTTLYATFFPCPHCASLIIQAGITRIVALPNPGDERYRQRRLISEQMFTEAGVDF